MFWWFERKGSYRRCEILALANGDYELRILDEDGSEHVEHFTDAESLNARQRKILEELSAEGWSGPHGWVL